LSAIYGPETGIGMSFAVFIAKRQLMNTKKKKPAMTKKPMTKKEDVASSNDPKIDQDFPGFPHGTAREEIIKHQKSN